MLKASSTGVLEAAVAGTDYVAPSALSGYLPLSGGTLTGALSGTTASFSGAVTGASFNVSNGSVSNSGFWGMLNTAGTGSFADWALVNSSTSGIMYNPTGTLNMVFAGSINGTSAAFSGAGSFLGNVGIGTASPTSMLTLNGTTPFIRIERSGVNTWQIQNNNVGTVTGFSINNITTATTPFMISESTGNTLIKTTTDNGTDALQVAGSVSATSSVTALGALVGGNGGSITNKIGTVNMGFSGNGYPALGYNIRYTGTGNTYQYDVTDVSWQLAFGDLSTFRLRYAPSGTAGNTISYTDFLTVTTSGAATFSSSVTANSSITAGGGNAVFRVIPTASGTYGSAAWQEWFRADGSTRRAIIGFGSGNDQRFQYYTQETGASQEFYTGNGVLALTLASNQAATFSSTVTATGFIVSSDRRLKNIVSRSGDMVTYTLKNDNTKQLHYGYIAQEVEKTLPTTVSTDDKGMKAVNYIEVLVKKVNDLEKEIAELKKHNK
jgi:hypothetical protein